MRTVFKEHIVQHQPYIGGSTRPASGIGQTLYKLSSNENLLGPSPMAVTAIRAQLSRLHEYQHQDDMMFKEALSLHFKESLIPTQFVCANSGMELLDIICRAFLNPGDEAILSTPTFLAYKSFIEVNGGVVLDVPLLRPGYGLDVEGILLAVNSKTKLIFISSPNNPMGSIATKDDMDRLMEKLPAHVTVVYDEVYHDFVEDSHYASAIDYIKKDYPVIGLHSFSKAYGLAGIRLGYAFSTFVIASYLDHLRRPFMINSLSMAAGIAALQDSEHLAKTKQMVIQGKQWLCEQFEKLEILYLNSHGNFIFFIPTLSPVFFAEEMLELGVMVRTGNVFGAPVGVRVTIGTHTANKAFINAFKKLL